MAVDALAEAPDDPELLAVATDAAWRLEYGQEALTYAQRWEQHASTDLERVEAMRAAGLTVEVIASEGLVSVEGLEWLCAPVDGLVSARHVAVVITRP